MKASHIGERFGRSAKTYDQAATVQREVAERLMALAMPYLPSGGRLFEVGCGTGMLTLPLLETLRPERATLCDISEEMVAATLEKIGLPECEIECLVADAENAEWPECETIASASAIQWFDDPTIFADKAAGSLSRNGILLFATYGPKTFCELRGMADNSTYPTMGIWTEKLRADFEILESVREIRKQTFASKNELLRHIVLTGVGSVKKSAPSPTIGEDTRELTYEVMLFVCKKKSR